MTDAPIAPPYLATAGPDAGEAEREWRAAASGAVVADASSLGLIEIEGRDTADFLQGQLSNDVVALDPGQGQWTTYNSPKGRMLATLFLMRDPSGERHSALLACDLVEPTAKRLAMFVLRAKVAIRSAEKPYRSLGVGGPDAARAIESTFGAAPPAGGVAMRDGARVAHFPDGRFIVIAPQAASPAVLEALSTHATPAGAHVWAWLGVRAGVPMITRATQDQFVAQAANWDVLGGLNFRKGCFTGQEVVARTQHLGRLKERLYAFRAAVDAPQGGTRLFSKVFGDQASGTVVNSAPDPDGGSRFLAVAQIAAADAGPMAIGAPDGPQVHREPLPYDLPAPAAPRGRVGA